MLVKLNSVVLNLGMPIVNHVFKKNSNSEIFSKLSNFRACCYCHKIFFFLLMKIEFSLLFLISDVESTFTRKKGAPKLIEMKRLFHHVREGKNLPSILKTIFGALI